MSNKIFVLGFTSLLVFSLTLNSCKKRLDNVEDPKPTPTSSQSGNPEPTPPNPKPTPTSNPNGEPTPTPNPNPNLNSIGIFFNNAYKGLAQDNKDTIKKDPKSPYKVMLNLIESAQSKIDIAIYDLGDEEIAQSFVNANKRGVKVRVITDTDNINKKGINLLKNVQIPIIEDKRSRIMHDKFIIIDDNLVWTGSMNLTSSSLYEHNNVSIFYKSTDMVTIFQNEFNSMFEKKIFDGSNHSNQNNEVSIDGNIPVKTYFSPKGNTKNAIVEELKKAKKSIKFMAFSFTDKDMVQIMIDKNNNNVKVQGIFDGCQLGSQYSAYHTLKSSKVEIYRDGNQALMHEKNMIIDDETVITGSFNFSANADKNNNENCMIIKSPEVAKVFSDEYDKLKTSAKTNTNLPPYNSPGCSGNGGAESNLY